MVTNDSSPSDNYIKTVREEGSRLAEVMQNNIKIKTGKDCTVKFLVKDSEKFEFTAEEENLIAKLEDAGMERIYAIQWYTDLLVHRLSEQLMREPTTILLKKDEFPG